MKSNVPRYTRAYFAQKLADYLRVRHPQLKNPAGIIQRRSNLAYNRYRFARRGGADAFSALAQADSALYAGLIFSRFDMI